MSKLKISKTLRSKLAKIKAIVTDVDGVLTDGTFWWDKDELELKRFHFADITGIPLAQRAGIKIALMSGESSHSGMAIVDRYSKKLRIEDVYKGCHDKQRAVKEFAKKYGLELSDICFVGDDINDLPAMMVTGLSVAPKNANDSVLEFVDIISSKDGGQGVIREVIGFILSSRNSK